MGHFDTIVAPISASGRAAISVIRVSGDQAQEVVAKVFDGLPTEPESHRAYFGRFTTGDDGLALWFASGRGYTGETSAELSIHGSPASVNALLAKCLEAGARLAEPGEFTRRAFMNGRLDLTQAEAVRETIEADTDLQLRAANRNRDGLLRRKIEEVMEPLTRVLVAVEACTDFSEEIGELDKPLSLERIENASRSLNALLSTASASRALSEGVQIALVGRPNVGKSSLLNALLGQDRAIVTDIAGTTRDTVEETVDFAGLRCRLTDTAGLRDSVDTVEKIGIERSRQAIAGADLVWFVFDAASGFSPEDEELLAGIFGEVLVVGNKSDLLEAGTSLPRGRRGSVSEANSGEEGFADLAALPGPAASYRSDAEQDLRSSRGRPIVLVSATKAEGFAQLAEATAKKLQNLQLGSEAAINSRQLPLLKRAQDSVEKAKETLESDLPVDLTSVCIRDALDALGEITGKNATADILDQIFKDFCIGK